MIKQANFLEISEDLSSIGPILQEWIKQLPTAQQEILGDQFHKASELFSSKDLISKIEKKEIFNEQTLHKTLGLKEETLQLIYGMAYEQHQNGEEKKARALFRFLSFLNPLNVDYWMGLGTCLFIEGKIVEAHETFEVARAVDPTNPEPLFFISRCLQMFGKLKEAMEMCQQSILHSEKMLNAPCYKAAKDLEQQLEGQLKKT